MVAPAIDLDHHALAAPEEVDPVVGVAQEQVAVDLGWWQAGLLAEVAEAPLKPAGRDVLAEVAAAEDDAELADAGPTLGAGEEVADRVRVEEAFEDSLLAGSLELGLREDRGEVEEGARGPL